MDFKGSDNLFSASASNSKWISVSEQQTLHFLVNWNSAGNFTEPIPAYVFPLALMLHQLKCIFINIWQQ